MASSCGKWSLLKWLLNDVGKYSSKLFLCLKLCYLFTCMYGTSFFLGKKNVCHVLEKIWLKCNDIVFGRFVSFNVNFLLGADTKSKDRESGWTALHRALFYGQLSCARELVMVTLSYRIQLL